MRRRGWRKFKNAAREAIDTGIQQTQNSCMTLKTLKEMRDATPFKSFGIHLADGRTLTVATADHLFFMPNHTEFLLVLPDGGFRFVDLAQVVSAGRDSSRAKTQ